MLSADNLNFIKRWLEESDADHDDMRMHTRATISMGRGLVLSMSKKQNLNTIVFTEAELIGVDDTLLKMI